MESPGHGHAKKSLGQHFLVDRSAIARITAAIPEGANAMEIGPGRGAITESLLKRVGRLILVEKDDDLAAMWQERSESEPKLKLVHDDVLQCLIPTVAEHHPAWIAGNLPYNISGPLSAALFSLNLAGGLVLMYQREVADRINADAGGKTYGGLSVLARHFYDVKRLLVLPPGAFSPPPKVYSAVLFFTPHGRVPACDFDVLQRAVRQGFAHRRKTIHNNFRGEMTTDDWAAIHIDPGTRPEQLDYPAWARLATHLAIKSGNFSPQSPQSYAK